MIMKFATVLISSILAGSLTLHSFAQPNQPRPCYLGECEPTTPRTQEPQPAPPRNQPSSNDTSGLFRPEIHPSFAVKLCFAGFASTPVNGAQMCRALYQNPSYGRKNNLNISCHVVMPALQDIYDVLYYPAIATAGACFDLGDPSMGGARELFPLCQIDFPEGFSHYRFDVTPEQCQNLDNSTIYFRPYSRRPRILRKY